MIIVSPILFSRVLKNYTGITLWPFIIVRYNLRDYGARLFAVLINHERIHLRQQLETLVIFFYLLYLIFYIINRCRGMNHMAAYSNIPFERESYIYERDICYLKKRRLFAWTKFV